MYLYMFAVAPRRGAWIEIDLSLRIYYCCTSLPAGERGLKLDGRCRCGSGRSVAPRRGAWIEMLLSRHGMFVVIVAPRRGAWIEICFLLISRSKLSRVAPRRGAWIEIPGVPERSPGPGTVAPRRGAWIEIIIKNLLKDIVPSLPAGERGLKSQDRQSPL